jgi:predicted RNA-binding Zn-ribbon protein involved in translation (DUF1610 family)
MILLHKNNTKGETTMKCPSCGLEFTPPGKSVYNCLMCGEPLVKPTASKKCETLAEVLAFVAETYGTDALLRGEWLVAFMSDCLPKGKVERNFVRNAFAVGIPQKLMDAVKKDPSEQGVLMSRLVETMVKDFDVAQETATERLWMFANALGWQGQPPAKTEAAPPQTAPLMPATHAPSSINERGNSVGNIVNGGFAAIQGDRIYYRNCSDGGKLYTVKTDGSDRRPVD